MGDSPKGQDPDLNWGQFDCLTLQRSTWVTAIKTMPVGEFFTSCSHTALEVLDWFGGRPFAPWS